MARAATPRHQRGARRGTHGPTDPPFVGRALVRARIRVALERAEAVLVVGRAGIGKSRLGQEVARDLRDAGVEVITRHATPLTSQLAFGVLADLIDIPTGGSAAETIAAAHRAMGSRLARNRSVLVVDDAHLLDDASALVLQRVIENRAAAILLACRRRADLPPGLQALVRSGVVQMHELAALGQEETWGLATAIGQAEGTPSSLHALTGGVPLFVIARARVASGGDLADILADVLRLSEPVDLDTLELVALGAPLELDTVETLSGARSIERLESAGLVVVSLERRRRTVRVSHPLYAEILLSQLPELRRRRQLRRLLEATDGLDGRHDDPLRRIVWRLATGDPVDDVELVAAAHRSLRLGGLALAERIVRDHLDPTASAEHACLAASVHLERARPSDAAAACAAAPASGGDEVQVKLGITWAIALHAHLGDVPGARAALDSVRNRVSQRARRQLDFFEIAMCFYGGDVSGAVAIVDSFLAEPHLPELTRAWFMLPGLLALATAGRATEAVQHGKRVAELVPRYASEIVALEAHAWCTRVYAAVHHGDIRPNLDELARNVPGDGAEDDTVAAGLRRLVAGLVALHADHLSDAIRLLDLADGLGGGWELAGRAWRVQALALAGRIQDAAHDAASLAAPPTFAFHAPLNSMARAELLLAGGDLDAALTELDAAEAHAAAHGQWTFALQAAFRRFVARPTSSSAVALTRVAARHDGLLGARSAELARAWSDRDEVAMALAADALDTAGLHLMARLSRSLLGPSAVVPTPELSAPTSQRRLAEDLTAREKVVLAAAADGLSDAEIAERLGISHRTVHAHLRAIYRKLDIRGRRDL